MNRRALLGTLGVVSLVAAPLAAEAQPAGVPRIGVLAPITCSHPNYQALREGLRALGYVEGQTIIIECREAAGRYERAAEHAAELVRLKVDVLVTDGLPAARAAKQATKTIPVVMGAVGDPVRGGVVNSLARPGANITGLTLVTAEMNTKRLEFLKAAVPGSTRVGRAHESGQSELRPWRRRETEVAARSLGLTLHVVQARGPADLDRAFSEILKGKREQSSFLPDPMLFAQRTRIAALAVKSQLPAVGEAREFAAAGGLMAYGPRITENFRHAAVYVDKILKGADLRSPGRATHDVRPRHQPQGRPGAGPDDPPVPC